MSETKQLADLEDFPEGWKSATFGDVAEFVRGVTYKKAVARDAMESGYTPLLRATNLQDDFIDYGACVFVPESAVKPDQWLCPNDLVVATSSGSSSVVGKSGPVVGAFEGTFGAFCAVIRPYEGIQPRYLHLFAQSPDVRQTWSALARGTNINNLKEQQVLSTVIPVAPLEEQERIVEILEDQLSRLDTALESVRTVREKAAQFRRSLLHAAFTGALTGHDVEEGELPEGWVPSTLGQVAQWGSGGTPKSGVTRYYGGDIPWAVIRDLNDDVVLTTESSITDEGLNESSAKMIEPGSILVAMYGSIGKLGLAGQPMSTNQAIAFANPLSDCITERFLFYFLMSQRELLLRAGKGATQQNISQTILKSWPISVPPLEEQERIVEILEDQLSRLDASLATADAVEERSAALRRSLLHSAFTGRLTREWRDAVNV